MFRKTTIIIVFAICSFPNCKTMASEPNDYIIPGRELLFQRTLSGIREAYDIFDNGLNDSNCVDCGTNRELRFLHILTRIIMWSAKDDGAPVDSFIEFAQVFGIEVLGNKFEELQLRFPDYPVSQYGDFNMPQTTPDVNELRDFLHTSLIPNFDDLIQTGVIPEVNSVISELDLITETPLDEFRIFFHPYETGLQADLELDYGEVLILKALLNILKSILEAKTAYDIFTDPNDILIEKIYAESININSDLLDAYPDLLKVLPTEANPNDGKLLLAQSKQDLINAIEYYFMAIDYMLSEEDLQEDDVLYVDVRAYELKDRIDTILEILKNSLISDTSVTHAHAITESFNLVDGNSSDRGYLVFTLDPLGGFQDGNMSFLIDEVFPTEWNIKDFTITDFYFLAELELKNGWGGGLLSGIISSSHEKINNATFEYWGNYYGDVNGLSATRINRSTNDVQFDLNPVFGSSIRYPQPLNPRDLLPQFDSWNEPVPGTMGYGLSCDSTLRGILPDATQQYWRTLLNMQPAGLFYLQEIYPWQIQTGAMEPYVSLWLENQIIFDDPSEDFEEGSNTVENVDIERLYLGYDYLNIYGSIILYDYNDLSSTDSKYTLYLSYKYDNPSSLHSIKLEIDLQGGVTWGNIYYMTYSFGYKYWQLMGSFYTRNGFEGIDFSIPWDYIPDYLPGRYIGLKSHGYNYYAYESNGETNITKLKIGDVGSISGTVSCDPASYQGQPIYIQACTDWSDPEGSLVASTVIEEPGPYILEGIGLGWEGQVRAYMQCYDLDTVGIDVREVEDIVPVFLWETETTDVDFILASCTLPCRQATEVQAGIPYQDTIEEAVEEIWFYFMADTNEVLSISITGDVWGAITVYDKCLGQELASGDYYNGVKVNVTADVNYYIQYEPFGSLGDYTLSVSHYAPAIENDRCEDSIQAFMDTDYIGTNEGALNDLEMECGIGDIHDVWYKFVPTQDAVYMLEINSAFSYPTIAVFDSCGGKELLCSSSWSNSLIAYINAQFGVEYYIRIAGQYGYSGQYTFRITQYEYPLINDLCENAELLLAGIPASGSTRGAQDNDVWYSFTPDTDGIFDINITDLNAKLKILDECGGKKVGTGSHYSVVYFNGKNQVTYFIGVETIWPQEGGDFTLEVTYAGQPLQNDFREDASTIDVNIPVNGSTVNATKDGESMCGIADDLDVWHLFTPVNSGIYKVKFTNSDFDAAFTVFDDDWPLWMGQLNGIICRTYYDSRPAYFYARSGGKYYIRIAGSWGTTGSYTIMLEKVSNDVFACDLNADNIIDWEDIAILVAHWLNYCPQPYWCGGADVNGDKKIMFSDFALLAKYWLKVIP